MKVELSLPDDLRDFIDTKVASGPYSSASDVVTVALRHFQIAQEEDAAKLQWLREACRVGIESGDAGDIDFEDIKAEGRALMKQRAAG